MTNNLYIVLICINGPSFFKTIKIQLEEYKAKI